MLDDQEKRQNPDADDELEGEGCEAAEACETDGEESKKGTRKKPEKAAAPAPAKPPATPAPAAARFAYPFNVRYAAEILDLTGFVDGQEYTETQIKDLLIANGYTEFADVEPAFHRSEATNTLVITIKGSKKGVQQIAADLVCRAELLFLTTYERARTEDRVLVYRNGDGDTWLVWPTAERSSGRVECDAPLSIAVAGQDWDLIADLHSHHVMGAFWSSTDDRNERLRGITFGVFSWRDDQATWLFRRWTGQAFEDLSYEQVVAGG